MGLGFGVRVGARVRVRVRVRCASGTRAEMSKRPLTVTMNSVREEGRKRLAVASVVE